MGVTGRDIRLYAALMLFRLGKLSSGAAAELAGKHVHPNLCAEVLELTGEHS